MLRERPVRIGAKVVSHGRYVTFQLAEVAVPRTLFREILHLIDDLRPRPAPAIAFDSRMCYRFRPFRGATWEISVCCPWARKERQG